MYRQIRGRLDALEVGERIGWVGVETECRRTDKGRRFLDV